ncbi:uncharacterized protein AMSG_10504 [Thecamonas trahens ATCC 50062]|uniref:Transforming acidic coiled-coil-containing protein C-terminal domain-containing protein n=1 Tax=Thecamonas trahens ATCC 50062 TaxID=461836 RepID=A0A0L0DQF8_THETB|nr:hypothetical protein AMSG_10504 [Thecamonas trahens ATCC 50062]KNC54505.1 hypothetical protein AMSG_10504 [Thecamonas trahens ATCC 50062]|eukprot:XP_013753658.1 hypothetical protein AMSG_10504 [Thecamonas trahens ATCC 50062]
MAASTTPFTPTRVLGERNTGGCEAFGAQGDNGGSMAATMRGEGSSLLCQAVDSPATVAWRDRTEVITPIDHAIVVEAANEVVASLVEAAVAGGEENVPRGAEVVTPSKSKAAGGAAADEKPATPLQARFVEVMAKSAEMLSPRRSVSGGSSGTPSAVVKALARVAQLEADLAAAEAGKSKAEEEAAQLTAVLDEFTATVDEIEARNDSLTAKVAELTAVNAKYAEDSMALEMGFKEWKAKALAAEAQLEAQANTVIELEAKHSNETMRAQKALIKAEDALAAAEADAAARVKIKTLSGQVAAKDAENAELTQICDGLLEQLGE